MEIKYQSSLDHQQKGVDAIVKVFEDVTINRPLQLYENPTVNLDDLQIKNNIQLIQADNRYNVDTEFRNPQLNPDCLTLDIKMETGTGKTYVYTHTIYELHKRYGINKFIVAVPSLAIKEGAKSFLGDPDVRRHFSNTCGYNAEIDLCVLNAMQVKKGKRFFPSTVRAFVNGSSQTTNQIYVLLVNMALLTDRKDGLLGRDDYDYGAQGFYRPLDALKATKPFVIIDEPHRFSRDQKAYSIIKEQICPQCVIRFGATFPEIKSKGKNKDPRKDYENLLYNLNSCQAFNQNLIKGVAKEHLESPSKKNEKIKLLSIVSKFSVNFSHITAQGTQSHVLYKGDSLGSISTDMDGLTIDAIGKDFVEFSNGQTKRVGEEFDVTLFAFSYQEAMLRLAIERHFETERINFNRSQRIKTLALFFIDDIVSFRGDASGNGAWLRDTFENLLKERLEEELKMSNSPNYSDFLTASLNNLRDCSAGYFAQDNSDSDESIAKEVDDILRNKKELLSFKDKDGKWITRRFLFSKWTLKEGWDNPNVFTIAKLRSSGSENSKIQEVGRGLRLPVDEFGNRISNEEFLLNYIVDFKEADFADKLVAEINGDTTSSGNTIVITEAELSRVAALRKMDATTLFIELLKKGYVDINKNVVTSMITAFYNDYPEFNTGVNRTKVIDRNKKVTNTVKIRASQYQELKTLWEKINQKYILFFEKEFDKKVEQDFHLNEGAFTFEIIESKRATVETTEKEASVISNSGVQYELHGKTIKYNEFLRRISLSTSLPIRIVHQKVTEYFKNYQYDTMYINESSVTNFISQFNDWTIKNVKGLLHYMKANYNAVETALTDVNGNLRPEIAIDRIGTMFEKGTPSKKYLYEGIFFESDLEKKNIISDIDEVVVFGKIPRKSIAIPTVIGNYSPDFMYVVKKKDGATELNVIIETKGVDLKSALRNTEQIRIDCAKIFFEQLQKDGFDVKFRTQINNEEMKKIVSELFI